MMRTRQKKGLCAACVSLFSAIWLCCGTALAEEAPSNTVQLDIPAKSCILTDSAGNVLYDNESMKAVLTNCPNGCGHMTAGTMHGAQPATRAAKAVGRMAACTARRMAAKAVALEEAEKPEFRDYAASIVRNAKHLAQACVNEGIPVATGGTDNHLMLLDVRPFGLNGRQAESLLRECGITLNRNALPFDPNGPWYTSVLRIGTPALTTLGMGEAEMEEVASVIASVLKNAHPVKLTKGEHAGELSRNKAKAPEEVMEEAKKRVISLLERFVLYPELDLAFLEKEFPLCEE